MNHIFERLGRTSIREILKKVVVDGDELFVSLKEFVHDAPEIQEYYSRSRRRSAEGGKQCLICGVMAVAVDKHPAVKIPGGTSSGIALMSFNSDAFESYGLSRNPMRRCAAIARTPTQRR